MYNKLLKYKYINIQVNYNLNYFKQLYKVKLNVKMISNITNKNTTIKFKGKTQIKKLLNVICFYNPQ